MATDSVGRGSLWNLGFDAKVEGIPLTVMTQAFSDYSKCFAFHG